MPTLVRAIDVSSHQPRNLSSLIARNQARHVVVKLYLPEEAIDQEHSCAQIASARAAGCTVGGYIWCYRDLDPRKSVRDGVALARSCGLDLPMLWLDCETYQGSTFDPGPDAAWLRAAIDECKRLGVRPGIYTGFWWVREHFPGGPNAFAEFRDVPLWLADYDGVAELNFRSPFSGFTRLHGKQYSADGLDLNVFLEECCAPLSRARTIQQLQADNPNILRQLAEWRQARRRGGANPFDYAAFRRHVLDLGAPDCGEAEFVGFRAPTLTELEASNPNLGRQLAEWQQARLRNGGDPNDYAAFRQHLLALAAPDCGETEFLGFRPGTAAPPDGQPTAAGLFEVNAEGLRLRRVPGLAGQVLAELGRGTVLEAVDERTTEADGHSWRRVRTPSGMTGFVAAELLVPHRDESTGGGQLHFNPDTPTEFQVQDWTCSIRSTMWMLRSIGIEISPAEAQDGMSPRFVNSEVGLLDASGAGIVRFLAEKYGLRCVNQGVVSFDEVAEWAGRQPLAIGGRAWGVMGGATVGHWAAVRGVNAAGELVLANPARGATFGQLTLNRDQFAAKGPFSAVRVML